MNMARISSRTLAITPGLLPKDIFGILDKRNHLLIMITVVYASRIVTQRYLILVHRARVRMKTNA
jgi:hypothetical protein